MIIELSLFIALIVLLIYRQIRKKSSYFVDRNVKYDNFVPVLGTFKDAFRRKKSFFELISEVHNKFEGESIAGIFDSNNPAFMVRDPDILKQITVKEFDHFVNHRKMFDGENTGLFGMSLFIMRDQKWKDMRSILSPAFTGSKMRLMFDLVREVSEQASNYLKNHKDLTNGIDLDAKDFFSRYTNDVIASTAFGIKIDSMVDRNNDFYEMGTLKCDDYFIKLVADSMKFRKENNVVRNDVINILMEAKEKSGREWTDEELTAQCFLFFLAGFESVSTVMQFAAYELVVNQSIQKRLIREIEEVKKDLNGKPLTYEVLNGMKYLDAVVNEAIRKWPSAPSMDRECNEDIVLEDPVNGRNVNIKKGEGIYIPVAGIHRNPKYYPNPDVFDPNRFLENSEIVNEYYFIPFGAGPRKCIASRFALMETKSILFYLLSEFSLRKSEKTQIPLVLDNSSFSVKAKDGCWVKIYPNNTEEREQWMQE